MRIKPFLATLAIVALAASTTAASGRPPIRAR
jgi:hypothetical protein